tara:strand:+ start:954 stop:1838 length:885 start_codon:yes stop_codon:yes gene_type:complete
MTKILHVSNQSFKSSQIIKDLILRIQIQEIYKKQISKIKKNPFVVFKDDAISNQIIAQDIYEGYELRTLSSYFETNKKIKFKNKIFIDVGANLGNHSIFFSKIFKKVITFEPNPIVFPLLKYNTSFYKNIKNFNFGLFDENKSKILNVVNFNFAGSSLKHDNYSHKNYKKVKLKKLDSLNLKGRIGLIKIDVENSEFEVLKGSHKTIKRHKPTILFEQQSSEIKNFTSRSILLLKKYNYSFFCFYIPQLNGFFLSRMFKKITSIFFGQKIYIIKINKFKKKNYNMILAIHNNFL